MEGIGKGLEKMAINEQNISGLRLNTDFEVGWRREE